MAGAPATRRTPRSDMAASRGKPTTTRPDGRPAPTDDPPGNTAERSRRPGAPHDDRRPDTTKDRPLRSPLSQRPVLVARTCPWSGRPVAGPQSVADAPASMPDGDEPSYPQIAATFSALAEVGSNS